MKQIKRIFIGILIILLTFSQFSPYVVSAEELINATEDQNTIELELEAEINEKENTIDNETSNNNKSSNNNDVINNNESSNIENNDSINDNELNQNEPKEVVNEENQSNSSEQSNEVDELNKENQGLKVTSLKVSSIPFKEGDRHPDIIKIKQQLTLLGFGGMNINEHFGSYTTKRVKDFQKYYGLRANGQADIETINKLNQLTDENPFIEGKKHKDVVTLKEKLVALGYGGMNINETYGSFTAKRVKQFQTDYGLKAHGIVDDVTLNLIDSLFSSSFTLREGTKHKSVIDFKKNLTYLGFGGMNINETYGSYTTKRVKDFQKYYGLPQTGIGDSRTLAKIDEILSNPFHLNKKHEEVIPLKEKLIMLGYGGMNINQTYGSFTAKRVKQFQKDHGLVQNGIVDDKTQEKINELINSVFQEGSKHKAVINFKKLLTQFGFGGMNINENFGSYTAKRVRDFQKYYGLPQTGKGDKATLDKILELRSTPYKEGEKHPDIIELKNNLVKLGFGGMNINQTYGSFTAKKVKQLQSYYGLVPNGIADEPTRKKINDILSSPYVEGKKHPDVIEFKNNLVKLGFGGMNINETYGSYTAKRVSDLQKHYGLVVNGIVDEVTLNKINEVLTSPFQEGKKHKDVIKLKEDLRTLGYGGMNINETYGSYTAKRVRDFQRDHGLPVSGIADEVTRAKIKELLNSRRYSYYNITLSKAVNIQMKANPQTDKKYAYVSKLYVDEQNVVTATALYVRTGPGKSYSELGTLPKGSKVDIIGESGNFYIIKYNNTAWVQAMESDVRYYLNPKNFINDSRLQFQFLDLSRLSGASASLLNKYLKDKGILKGKGQAFIDAGLTYGVNEVYLLSHALLETGNGKSTLANGVRVGKNKKGNLVLVNSNNKNSLTDIKTVYNMYGIGAYDDCPLDCGAKRAYQEEWTTPEKAIIHGAAFIGNNYIKAGQNTLYKMRWNPQAMVELGKADHQYATDVGWAAKQVTNMYNLYREIGITNYFLDIPVYK